MLILIGVSPAAAAASIPSRTRSTGKPTSFIVWKTALSRLSRLTVIRWSPAALSVLACWARSEAVEVPTRQVHAPGQAELFDAMGSEEPGEACYLFEGQQLAPVEERVVAAEDFFRHAGGAAEG